MLRVACSACQSPFMAPESFQGHLVRCPKCRETFLVPAAEAEPSDEDTKPSHARSRRPARGKAGLPLAWILAGSALLIVGGAIVAGIVLGQGAANPVKEVAAKDAKPVSKDRQPEKKLPTQPDGTAPTGTTLVAEPNPTPPVEPLPKYAARRLGSARWRLPEQAQAVWTPDGTQILVAPGRLPGLQFLDALTGTVQKQFETKASGVIGITPDGKHFLSTTDKGYQLWDAASGEPVRLFPTKHMPFIPAVAFSADGKWLALLDGADFPKYNVLFYEMATARLVWKVETGNGVDGLAFAADGKRLAAMRAAGVVVWETDAGKVSGQFATKGTFGRAALAFTADGKQLVAVGSDIAYIWDTATQGKPEEVDLGGRGLAITADGRLLAARKRTPAGDLVVLWDVAQRQQLRTLPGTVGEVVNAEFTRAGQFLTMQEAHGTGLDQKGQVLRAWEVETGRERSPLVGHRAPVTALQFLPDGQTLVTTDSQETTRYWNLTDGRQRTLWADGSPRAAQAVSGDGTVVLLTGVKGYALHDLGKGPRPNLIDEKCNVAAFAPNGKQLAFLRHRDREYHLMLHDVANLTAARAIKLEQSSYRVVYSADGNRLATGSPPLWNSNDDDSCIVDPAAGKIVLKVAGRPFAFTAKEGHLVTGMLVGTVRFWNSTTGKLVGEVTVPLKGALYSLAVSPDGKYLAVGGDDEIVLLSGTGDKELARLPGHRGIVHALAFSPDSKHLASGGHDTTILLWDLDAIGK